jgi:hydrogenase maturation protease
LVSLIDPPPELAEAAAARDNRGLWLVLAGEDRATDVILSAPIILIDVVQRGDPPGTVSVIEPDWPSPDDVVADAMLLSPHEMHPEKVLRLAALLGGRCRRVLLVGCEAESLGDAEFGAEGLSPAVAAAVPRAAAATENLARELAADLAVEEMR